MSRIKIIINSIMILFLINLFLPLQRSYADYSLNYVGSSSPHVVIQTAFTGNYYSGGYFNTTYSVSTNPVYMPNNMLIGRVKLNLKLTYKYTDSTWKSDTVTNLNLNLIKQDGSEVFWKTITFNPFNYAVGDTIDLGDYVLDTNYKGIRIASFSETPSSYISTYTSGRFDGDLTFQCYSLTFNQTEVQFNDLVNKTSQAVNAANSANANADQARQHAINAESNSWYNGSYGGSQESVGSVAGYIKNKQLPDLETKINNLQVAVSSQPPDLQCSWQNGATITNSAREAILNVATSDSNATLAYSIDGGATYTTFTGNSVKITFPSTPKYATVYVRATNQSGKQTIKTLSIFVQ